MFLFTLVFSLGKYYYTLLYNAQHVDPFPELVSSQETPYSLAAVVFECQRPATDGNGVDQFGECEVERMQPLSDLKHGDSMAKFAARFLTSENVSWSMFSLWNCRGSWIFKGASAQYPGFD